MDASYATLTLEAARRRVAKAREAETESEKCRNMAIAISHFEELDQMATLGLLPKEWDDSDDSGSYRDGRT